MDLTKRICGLVGVVSLVSFSVSFLALGADIGVIDSGTDLKHPMLRDHAWVNPNEKNDGADNDGNSYVDDMNGWNFAERNNQIIDYSYLGTFSPDTAKFFEVQLRVIEGTATDADKKWLEEKRKDQTFIEELTTFANFVHGTHVAGIASRSAVQSHIMAAKIIPTKIKPVAHFIASQYSRIFNFYSIEAAGPQDDMLMQGALGMIAGQQTKSLTAVGTYVAKTGMKVSNCSFGTGGAQAEMVVKMIGKMLLQRELTDEEVSKYAKYFINQVLEKGSSFVTSANNNLFVMAAGNDGSDNDSKPVFPANLKYDNTITVAATRGFDRLASFSNFGAKKVDIAAPGVGIVSSIPGEGTMAMSGTSQAAPYIANLAGKILDVNPKLSPKEVKQILMSTVDKKAFLIGKVVSEGIANEQRALSAAEKSISGRLSDAIAQSFVDVPEAAQPLKAVSGLALRDSGDDGLPVPMPSLFSFE